MLIGTIPPPAEQPLDLGLTSAETVKKTEVTRGDLAVMLYRALAGTEQESLLPGMRTP